YYQYHIIYHRKADPGTTLPESLRDDPVQPLRRDAYVTDALVPIKFSRSRVNRASEARMLPRTPADTTAGTQAACMKMPGIRLRRTTGNPHTTCA
ncbi:MAG: hypothetical protein LBL85_00485, partial [Methanocalculaceae archaeon]|nr:hypothetical protein [Methanocalculaceae archaeon]